MSDHFAAVADAEEVRGKNRPRPLIRKSDEELCNIFLEQGNTDFVRLIQALFKKNIKFHRKDSEGDILGFNFTPALQKAFLGERYVFTCGCTWEV